MISYSYLTSQLMVPLCWQWVYPSEVQRITYLCGVLSAYKQFMPLCCPQMPSSPLLAALGTEPRMFTPSSFMVFFWSFATLQNEHKFSFALFSCFGWGFLCEALYELYRLPVGPDLIHLSEVTRTLEAFLSRVSQVYVHMRTSHSRTRRLTHATASWE